MTNNRRYASVAALVALLVFPLGACSGPQNQGTASGTGDSSIADSTSPATGGNTADTDIREALVEKLAQHCPDISGFASTPSSWIVDDTTTSAPYYVYLNGDGGAVVLWFSPDSNARPFEVDAEYAETTNLLLSYANCDFTEAVEEMPTESEEETVSGHY